MENRRYGHDCEICTFLGQFEDYDLYFCPQKSGNFTVLARWGEYEKYYSGIAFAKNFNPLAEAEKRAREKGLL